VEAFSDLMKADPDAFRTKFRKMAADPFAFYRGSACVFYADVADREDRWADERTSRVWIQGDLHVENFGTYMDGSGVLIFDVNDFDEAYVGHFTWDLQRFAASVALMCWQKALSDDEISRLIETFTRAYIRQVQWFTEVDDDASFSLIYAHCGVLRERVLRAAQICFGHRLMRDCVVPGGTSVDLDEKSIATLHALLRDVRQQFPEIVSTYDNTASLQDRTVATGVLTPAFARQFGAGGYVGRASGRPFDARRAFAYRPYDQLEFAVPILEEGDVNARVWIRIREVEQSLSLVEQILARIPDGPIRANLPARGGEGVALVEGFRGDILVWLRLDDSGCVSRCYLRDHSWFQWPLMEAAIEGNIVADFPLCNKSFNCSYSGHDL
jgi:hypothetical protein